MKPINQDLIDVMNTLSDDYAEWGVPRHDILDCIRRLGQRCMAEELYEFMPAIHEMYDKINTQI